MSTLFLGTDPASLAEPLAAELATRASADDFFRPTMVIVPNRYLGKWLRLWLARRLGVAINLKFTYLEEALGELLRELDPRGERRKLLDADQLRMLILTDLLLEQPLARSAPIYRSRGRNPDRINAVTTSNDSDPLRQYLPSEDRRQRTFYRRAWQLAGRLAGHLRDYEYHRQDELIQPWLHAENGATVSENALERSQQELFQRLVEPETGWQAVLGTLDGQPLQTLPQYAHEVMKLGNQLLPPSQRPIHLFGMSQLSATHIRTLRWLGESYDLRLYHLNPLIGRFARSSKAKKTGSSELQRWAEAYRDSEIRDGALPGEPLARAWGRAGAESLWLMAELLKGRNGFKLQWVHATEANQSKSVLHRLQADLLGQAASVETLAQDCSLQIVACPGMIREVETVYQSILHNLHKDAGLKQTDIAVLATDMAQYRPVIQTVFDREPRALQYNLADFSASALSAFGHALLGMLDLALESFTRTRVFAVLLNPCFLAKLGVDREQALTWLQWAESLGIFHSWDTADKRDRGYGESPLYSWQLGLQRLRLGRIMEIKDDEGVAPAYRHVVPYADLHSSDKEELDPFCRAVEELLPALASLRRKRAGGRQWAAAIRELIGQFLAIPADRPEEEEVRDRILKVLPQLGQLDELSASRQREMDLPLAFAREFVAEHLEHLEGTSGDYLTGGVTISALQPLRPVPFRIIYVLGLGEGQFPGSDAVSSLDLRSRERCPGDILPAESNRFLFLEALLAASEKIYLCYPSREVLKDQPLHPCSPINQLRRYLEKQILGGKFVETIVPLRGNDRKYVEPPAANGVSDAIVSYDAMERLSAIDEAKRDGIVALTENQARDVDRRLAQARHDETLPSDKVEAEDVVTVSVTELKRFLLNPVEAALRRHLRLSDDEDTELVDDEPFYASFPHDHVFFATMLRWFVGFALETSVERAREKWRDRLADAHRDWRRRGRLPEGTFGDLDQDRFEHLLEDRIDRLAQFLKEPAEFCGPLLIGESWTPLSPRCRFPAPALDLGNGKRARIVGHWSFVWRTEASVEVLVISNSMNPKCTQDKLCKWLLEPALFCLALQVGTEAGQDGVSSAEWVGDRAFNISVLASSELVKYRYEHEDLRSDETRHYLATLVEEYLDRRTYDLLPFDVIANARELQQAYELPDGDGTLDTLRASFSEELKDTIEQSEDSDYSGYRPMELLRIVEAQVPRDAFDKVRRRFQLLDQAPARVR